MWCGMGGSDAFAAANGRFRMTLPLRTLLSSACLLIGVGGCTLTSVATAPSDDRSVCLDMATCTDGTPAVAVRGIAAQQTGGRRTYEASSAPGVLFLRPGLYVIDVACFRNTIACGFDSEGPPSGRAAQMLMTHFDANATKVLDCNASSGTPFVSTKSPP